MPSSRCSEVLLRRVSQPGKQLIFIGETGGGQMLIASNDTASHEFLSHDSVLKYSSIHTLRTQNTC